MRKSKTKDQLVPVPVWNPKLEKFEVGPMLMDKHQHIVNNLVGTFNLSAKFIKDKKNKVAGNYFNSRIIVAAELIKSNYVVSFPYTSDPYAPLLIQVDDETLTVYSTYTSFLSKTDKKWKVELPEDIELKYDILACYIIPEDRVRLYDMSNYKDGKSLWIEASETFKDLEFSK